MRNRGDLVDSDDGNRVCRICVTMGANEFLRGDSNHESNLSYPIYRRGYCRMIMRRVQCGECDIK